MARKTIDQTGAEVSGPTAEVAVVADHDVIMDQAKALIMGIPEAVDGDGSGLLSAILSANTLDELQEGQHLDSARDLAGRTIKVTELSRRESDLDSELGWYVIVRGVDLETNRPVQFSTSALGVVLPLAKLHSWGSLPAIVKITEADRPTKAGYRPLNLTVQAAAPGGQSNHG